MEIIFTLRHKCNGVSYLELLVFAEHKFTVDVKHYCYLTCQLDRSREATNKTVRSGTMFTCSL